MKTPLAFLAVLALLAAAPMASAAQPAVTGDEAPPTAIAPSQTPEILEAAPEELPGSCDGDAQTPLLAEPLQDVVPQSHCNSGFPVDSCSECPGCACVRFIHPCCYCQ